MSLRISRERARACTLHFSEHFLSLLTWFSQPSCEVEREVLLFPRDIPGNSFARAISVVTQGSTLQGPSTWGSVNSQLKLWLM